MMHSLTLNFLLISGRAHVLQTVNVSYTFVDSTCVTVDFSFALNFWWIVRVTLVVGFGFLPKMLGPWWGATNAICIL